MTVHMRASPCQLGCNFCYDTTSTPWPFDRAPALLRDRRVHVGQAWQLMHEHCFSTPPVTPDRTSAKVPFSLCSPIAINISSALGIYFELGIERREEGPVPHSLGTWLHRLCLLCMDGRCILQAVREACQ